MSALWVGCFSLLHESWPLLKKINQVYSGFQKSRILSQHVFLSWFRRPSEKADDVQLNKKQE